MNVSKILRRTPLIAIVLAYHLQASEPELKRIVTSLEPSGNYPNEQGEIVGTSVDIVREIQRRTGSTVPIEMLP